MNIDDFEQVVRRRKTVKVLAHEPLPLTTDRAVIQRLIAQAGWAPFHKVCSVEHRSAGRLEGIEPWRFHALDAPSCRALRQRVIAMESAGKIPAMLGAATAVILATWLPNPSTHDTNGADVGESFDPTLGNVEHIAAASAAVQTLLLAATAAGWETYWSSGGVLRLPDVFAMLRIPTTERLLGAIFLFPADLQPSDGVDLALSKLRPQRCPPEQWSRWVELNPTQAF